MSKKKILTLEKQKHLYNSLVEIFKDLDQDEIDQILQNLGLDSFIQNAGIYSLNIKSSAPTYIIDNYNTTLTANLYSYFLDVTDKVLSWQWERNSGNIAEDSLWKVGKTNASLELTEVDFPRLDSTDIEFKLTAVTEDGAITDTILFTRFQKYSKLQIVAVTGNVFLENNPNELVFKTSVTGFTVCNTCYEWYLDEVLISTNATVRVPYDLIKPSKVSTLKVVVQDNKGEEYEDYTSIARIMNGGDAATPYTLDLSNDNVMIPANTDGSVTGPTSYYSANTEASLYLGTSEVSTNEYYITLENSQGISSVASNNNRTIYITSMDKDVDTGYVRFVAYSTDNKVIARASFNITKAKGVATYQLLVSPNSVKLNQSIKPGEQRFTPGEVKASVIKNDGTNVTTDHSGLVKYRYQFQQENGSTSEDGDHTLPVNGVVDLLDEIEEAEALAAVGIQFRLYHPVTQQICDSESVPIIKDGLPGFFIETRYNKTGSFTVPPTIDKTQNEPAGWTIDPPAIISTEVLYMATATKTADKRELVGIWSDPVRVSGPQGPKGDTGAASDLFIAPMGQYSATRKYIGNNKRVEAVTYNSSWYVTRQDADSMNGGTGIPVGTAPDNTAYWNQADRNFNFIATGLFLAEAAYIDNLMVKNLITDQPTTENPTPKRIEIKSQDNSLKFYTDGAANPAIKLDAVGGSNSASGGTNNSASIVFKDTDSTNGTSSIGTDGVFSNTANTTFFSLSSGVSTKASIVGMIFGEEDPETMLTSYNTAVAGVNTINAANNQKGRHFGGFFDTIATGARFNIGVVQGTGVSSGSVLSSTGITVIYNADYTLALPNLKKVSEGWNQGVIWETTILKINAGSLTFTWNNGAQMLINKGNGGATAQNSPFNTTEGRNRYHIYWDGSYWQIFGTR